MLGEQHDTTSLVRDQAVAPVECDVPVGWSLDDWRTVRGLAREVIREPVGPWWRRRPWSSRRALN
ncbi:MAG TPA: hypothetical protein VK486_15030 [Thermoleophilaceae bacterium]|nr:hypothetical protein [Thermoleophilaceae bacterium]